MYKVLYNKKISSNSFEMQVEAPLVVRKAMPGQFVIVMAREDSERIPLTIYDYDKEKGLLSLIYQVVGASTEELTHVKDEIFGVAGPLGNPNEICADIENYRDKKVSNLERTAKRIAREVKMTKVEAKLEPMNSYERRIVHNALSNNKFVYTESVGEEPNRCVVIKLKEEK